MSPDLNNSKIAELLRSVAAAYQIKGLGNIFQIRAYENAATSVEHATQEIKDLWQEGKLREVPGIGAKIAEYLDELLRTGQVKHFEEVLRGIPESVASLLSIPGVGPKTAYRLAVEGRVDSIEHLKTKLASGRLLKAGFSEKSLANISRGIYQKERLSKRLLLPDAMKIAEEVIAGLKADPSVLEAYPLGSVRRMVPTVGDIDLAVSTKDSTRVIEVLANLSQVKDVVERGGAKATVVLKNGVQVDLMTGLPEHFGALLQHFTGSKQHNIHLRELANEAGWTLSEYGLKNIESGESANTSRESEIYSSLGLDTPPPEIREDSGEIELAQAHQLPLLIEEKDVQGDLHTHTFYSDGNDSVRDMAEAALKLGYKYLALTDHSYPNLDFDRRIKDIEEYNYSNNSIRVIKGLEVNITTEITLQVPDTILAKHEFNTASIHTGFHQTTALLTERVLFALSHPLINMISHPTGRLLGEREGYDLDWEKVFNAAQQSGKVLEVNGFPNRSDLPDQLIREAVKRKIKLAVDTDSHHKSHLDLMRFAVALARRGWATPDLVINSWSLDKLLEYLEQVRIKV